MPNHLSSLGPWGHQDPPNRTRVNCLYAAVQKKAGAGRGRKTNHRASPQGKEKEDFSEDGVKESVFDT